MAKSRNTKKGRRSSATRSRSARSKNGVGRDDAITLLKADHRQVERWFADFKSARSEERKLDLAERICQALRTHTSIEEEIFYPAFLEATEDKDLHHEAEIEHAGAKHLIGEIEAAGSDDHFEARVTVLEEMIRHHVKEEEQRGGMFAKAQSSSMDLQALGEDMKRRKLELMGEGGFDESRLPAAARSRRAGRELRARSG